MPRPCTGGRDDAGQEPPAQPQPAPTPLSRVTRRACTSRADQARELGVNRIQQPSPGRPQSIEQTQPPRATAPDPAQPDDERRQTPYHSHTHQQARSWRQRRGARRRGDNGWRRMLCPHSEAWPVLRVRPPLQKRLDRQAATQANAESVRVLRAGRADPARPAHEAIKSLPAVTATRRGM